MITIPSLNGYFSVTFQADYVDPSTLAMYTLSKSSIRVKREASPQLSIVKVHITPDPPLGATTITTYYTDPDGVLELDLHNVINSIYKSGVDNFIVSVYMYEMDGTTSVDSSVFSDIDILQGVSYNDIMAPKSKDIAGVLQSLSQTVIVPPNIMLNPATLGSVSSSKATLTWAATLGRIGATVSVARTTASCRAAHVPTN